MGNPWSCPPCPNSDPCAPQNLNVLQKNFDDRERAWKRKLKCLDLEHSKQNGLLEEDFYELLERIEKRVLPIDKPLCPNKFQLIDCLKANPCCIIKCSDFMNEFIDCVDTVRINKIKKQIRQTRKLEKQKEAKQIFN